MTVLDSLGSRKGAKVAFGDVVQLSKVRSKDPEADGIERYVGLEHLEPGDFKIRSWGNVADGTSFTNVFKPGQVLFGKRRAYQRKVAVADFHGVCSGDIYVLEPKGKYLLPELLPFICQTDAFFEHAVRTSAGSLSPRTNWRSQAKFEFVLPGVEEQHQLVDLLRPLSAALESYLEAIRAAEALRDGLIAYLLHNGCGRRERVETDIGCFPAHWDVLPLGHRYEIQLGKMMSPGARSGLGKIPYMRNANVQWNSLDLSDVETMSFTDEERKRFSLRYGDILACEGRHVGKSVIWRDEIPGACYQKALHRLRPLRLEMDAPEFLLLCLRYYYVSGRFFRVIGETTIPHLPAERFRKVSFPFPPLSEQVEIVARVSELDSQLQRLVARSTKLNSIIKVLSTETLLPS